MAVTAHSFRNAEQLEGAGADYVLMPYADTAAEAVNRLFGQDRQTALVSIPAVETKG
jgi:hypothetical protein